MIPELEKALNTCNIDELAAILAHDPSLINALNDKGVPICLCRRYAWESGS